MQDIEFVLSVSHKRAIGLSEHILTKLCQQFPHQTQQVMSAENTPILCGAIPSFETFMSAWERFTKGHHARLKTFTQPGLDCAYKYYARMDHTRAYVVTMCKCLCRPQIIRLSVICSPEPCHTYDVDKKALGT
jgi:hypothetical protein